MRESPVPVTEPETAGFVPTVAFGWILAIASIVAFSLATPIARGLILAGAAPTGLVFVRLLLATALNGATLGVSRPALFRANRRSIGISLLSGAINGAGMVLYFWGLTYLNASVAAMLLATSPLVVLSLLTLRGERFTYRHLLRIGLALSGVYLLVGPTGSVDITGVLLILASILAFSSQMVVVQWYLRSYDVRSVTFYVNTGMLLVVGVLWLAQGRSWSALTPGGWFAVVVLAVASTFLARWAMYSAIAILGSGQVSLLNPLEILLAVIWSVLFLQESLSLAHWIGGGLILTSALLAVQRINITPRRPRWRTWSRV